jgi:hypothetical protein
LRRGTASDWKSPARTSRASIATGGTIETETEQDFVQAVDRVYHDHVHPSYLVLPIIERV